jgi:hypothetical protein
VRHALEVAVDEDLLDLANARQQPLLQHADALAFGAHLGLGDAKASPMPTHWCVGSVPLRMPRSWPPPCICASSRTRGLRRTYSAPMPLGP